MRKLFCKIKNTLSTPGTFSKLVVLFCLGYSVRIIEWAMWQFEQSNMEAATLLTVSLGLFGGELLFLCLKRIFTKSDEKSNSSKNKVEASEDTYDPAVDGTGSD